VEAAPSVTLDFVAHTISGNGFTKTGPLDTSGSSTISAVIPLETTNLVADPSYAAVLGSLDSEIAALAPNAPDGFFP
jgi:hypothetical protein